MTPTEKLRGAVVVLRAAADNATREGEWHITQTSPNARLIALLGPSGARHVANLLEALARDYDLDDPTYDAALALARHINGDTE